MDNHLWRLARTPQTGWPQMADFAWCVEEPPSPGPGQVLTRTIYLSLDPYQWGRRRSGVEQVNEVCHGRTVSQVVRSHSDEYSDGDYLFNTNGWQEYGLTGTGISHFGYMYPRKLVRDHAPLSTAVGVLGMLGLTAYAGCDIQCRPQPGETAVISAASGGVGQVAGQIARIRGCRVVGVAGRQEKCDYVVNDLGFDACVSHLSETFEEELAAACPDGVDIYFENVGGKVFQGVLPLLNRNSRITLCGMISQYGNVDGSNAREVWDKMGRRTFSKQQVKVHGLFVGNYVDDYQERFLGEMAEWIRDGKVRYKEDIWEGLAKTPEAFAAMLQGGNFGKTIIRVSDE